MAVDTVITLATRGTPARYVWLIRRGSKEAR
jgi:hypothetical protein